MSRFNMGIRVQSSLIEPLLSETDFFLHAKVIFRRNGLAFCLLRELKTDYHSMQAFQSSFSLAKSPQRGLQITAYK